MGQPAYSADSHVVEPPELFNALERRFGERAPRVVHDPEWGDFLVTPGVTTGARFSARNAGVPIGRLGIAGMRLDNPETQRRIKLGYAGLRPGVLDARQRVKEQDEDGVQFEVLYPSLYFRIFGLPDNEVLLEAFRSYNDWIGGYTAAAPDRLLALALLPMQDPAAAATELKRAIKLEIGRASCRERV